MVNAVYHRSYEEREPIEVRISPREVSVLSFPGPDRSISLDALRQGRAISRRYRNRRIGEFLKELRLTEGRATGIPKILQAMRDNGSPVPAFEGDEGRVSFLVRLPVRAGLSRAATPQVTPQVETALLLFCIEPRSTQEILKKLRLKDRKSFSAVYLRPLIAAGLLEPTIPEKPQSRLQRYRTTAAGKARLPSGKTGAAIDLPGDAARTTPPKSDSSLKARLRKSKDR